MKKYKDIISTTLFILIMLIGHILILIVFCDEIHDFIFDENYQITNHLVGIICCIVAFGIDVNIVYDFIKGIKSKRNNKG